jgi:hypothetical protein
MHKIHNGNIARIKLPSNNLATSFKMPRKNVCNFKPDSYLPNFDSCTKYIVALHCSARDYAVCAA